eukprot:CAMPEP_0179887456 /NCGR_PEP_ID=MMETSP0982-20121206/31421_1 /TAXON_ID=483367 /ORGANISM="non described non described, Strain CCMP 2436" /LENGTH=46 /DNA_ID= /DNA_START= /DNA_END= /DNA_ORIENTATION=
MPASANITSPLSPSTSAVPPPVAASAAAAAVVRLSRAALTITALLC